MAMKFRLRVPPKARRGEQLDVRILIQHANETGFRRDDAGQAVPYNVIEELVCRYLGEEAVRFRMSSGIAANPLLQFFLVADRSGEIELEWRDTAGETGRAAATLAVEG